MLVRTNRSYYEIFHSRLADDPRRDLENMKIVQFDQRNRIYKNKTHILYVHVFIRVVFII